MRINAYNSNREVANETQGFDKTVRAQRLVLRARGRESHGINERTRKRGDTETYRNKRAARKSVNQKT